MPNREFPFNQPIHPEDNQSINRVFDRNYGNKLKSGDTTTLKYTIKDGDGEPLNKDRLIAMNTKVILKYDGIIAYETAFDAIIENETDNYAGDLVARFNVEEVLPPDEKKPYVIEFHFEELDQSDEVIDRFIFPSGNTLELFITPSALNSDGEAIDRASDERLGEAVKRAIESDVILLDIKEQEQQRIANEAARESAETARESAESAREEAFSTSEINRQSIFETNEEGRQGAFETNETARQSAESQRESTFTANETDRQSTFDTNENARQETFENNESERQTNYNELVDTGIMQENINEKLSESEQTYAPRLTNLEQNDANLTAQLAQTVDDVNRAASELTQDSEVILARGSYDYLGERLEDVDRRLTAQAVIMGVEWDKQPDPTLTRIGASKDLVANIGIGDEVVRNDFDQMPIYREIQKEVDVYGNVFVRIPKFYIRKTVTDSLKRIEISTEKLKNFYLPAIFYDFENQKELPYAHIGAYNAGISLDGTKLESKSGVKPLVSRNIVDFRNLAQTNGAGYQQLDIHAIDVIRTLFYVEFATLHSQSIHPGYTSGNTESLVSGFSDGIVASSGALSMSGTDGFMYRGIETPWGNIHQWVDGVNILDHQAWVCKDAENYTSNVYVSPYEKLGYVNHPENGIVKDMGFDPAHPYAEFPVEIGGNYTTNFADHYYQSTGKRVARFGGDWSYRFNAGLSCWHLGDGSSSVHSTCGGRLLKKPL